MVRVTFFALASTLMLAAMPAHTQDDADSTDLIVIAPSAPSDRQASHFVRELSSTSEGQLARFGEPICPSILGLSEIHAAVIEKRIRQVATDAKVEQVSAPCRANLILMIVKDSDEIVTGLRKHFPSMFAALDSSAHARAVSKGPVHTWSLIEVRNEDGVPLENGAAGAVRSASIINLPTEQAVIQSFVVINQDVLIGKTLTQIADYTAMRALARARPPKDPAAPPTILTLFNPGNAAPPQMTTIDEAYLKGLYSSRANARATAQMGAISRSIVKAGRKRAAGVESGPSSTPPR